MVNNEPDYNDPNIVTLRVGTEVEAPYRGVFVSFPYLTLMSVEVEGKWINTEYMPGANSVPSTRHPKTIRQIHFNWKKMYVEIEYDDITKKIKAIRGNVTSVVVRVK